MDKFICATCGTQFAETGQPPEQCDFFETLVKVLLRCWILGLVLLFIWLGAFLCGAVHKLHGSVMGMSNDALDVTHYCSMAFLKQNTAIAVHFGRSDSALPLRRITHQPPVFAGSVVDPDEQGRGLSRETFHVDDNRP